MWSQDFRGNIFGLITVSSSTGPDEESEDDPQLEGRDPDIWHVGFKISWDIETPGLAIPLRQGDCYFMLGNSEGRHPMILYCLSVTLLATYFECVF